jgi:hypothetical protein
MGYTEDDIAKFAIDGASSAADNVRYRGHRADDQISIYAIEHPRRGAPLRSWAVRGLCRGSDYDRDRPALRPQMRRNPKYLRGGLGWIGAMRSSGDRRRDCRASTLAVDRALVPTAEKQLRKPAHQKIVGNAKKCD